MGTVAGLLLLLFVGVVSYLKTPQAQEKIQRQIDRSIPGRVTWRRLDFSLFSGRFDIDDFLVEGPSRERLAGWERLHIDLAWTSLLKGRIALENGRIEAPWAALAAGEDGRLNLMQAFSEPAPEAPAPEPEASSGGLPFDVAVEALTLQGGRFSCRDSRAGLALTLADITVDVAAFRLSAPSGRLQLEIGSGVVESPVFTGPVDRLYADATLDADRPAPVVLELAAGGTRIDLNGTVAGPGANPILDLILDAELSLDELKHILQLAPEMSGRATLHATARGPLSDPEASVGLAYHGGRLGGVAVDRIRLALTLADRSVRIDPLQAASALGTLAADGKIDLKAAFPEGLLSPEPDLSRLSYRLNLRHQGLLLENAFPRDAGYRGRLDAKIRLEGTGVAPGDMAARCRVDINGQGIAAPGMQRPADVAAEVEAGIDGEEALLDRLSVDVVGLRLTSDGRYRFTNGELEGNAALASPDLSALLAAAGIADGRGAMTVNAAVGGSLSQPTGTLSASGEGLALPNVVLGDLHLAAELDDAGVVDIETLRLVNQDSRISLRGGIDLLAHRPGKPPTLREELPVEVALSLESVAPADFLPGAAARGRIDGTVAVQGPARSPEIQAEAAGKGLAIGDAAIGDVALQAAFSGGRVEIGRLALRNKRSALSVAGTATLLDGAMTPLEDPAFDLKILEGRLFPGDFLAGGEGELTLAGGLQGRLRNPAADLRLDGRGLAFSGARIGNVDARIQMTEGRIQLSPLDIRNGRSALHATAAADIMKPGSGALIQDPTLDVRISGERLFLEDFIDGMAGDLSIEGRIGGTATRPQGTLRLRGQRLDIGGQPLDSISVDAGMAGESITLDRLQAAVVPGETIDGTGRIDLARSAYDLRLSSQGVSLGSVRAVGGADQVSGKVALDVSGSGTFDDPRADGRIALTGLRINGKPLADLQVRLSLKDRQARLWGQPGFDLDAAYHLDRRDFRASVGFDGTELDPYLQIAGLNDLGGSVTGTVTARGTAGAATQIRAAVDLNGLTLRAREGEILAAPRLRARLESGAWTLDDTEIRLLREGRLRVGGRGSLAGKIAMAVDGRIPLAVLDPFLEEDPDADGTIRIDGRIAGTLSQPEIRADIVLERLGMDLPGLEQRLREVTGRITVSPGTLVLEGIDGRIDDGRFTLDGRIGLDGFRPDQMALEFTARQLPIEVPDTLSLLADSRLRLNGTAAASTLNGEITLLEGLYYRDVALNLLQGVTTKTREVAPQAPAGPPDFLDRMALNIVIRHREPFLVENNLAEMSLSPDLRILGTAARPVVSGRAAVDEGEITYQKRVFEIQKGVVDFLNPYRTEPTIDIKGEATVRDWIISLQVSGTPDNLDFKLTSTPAEEHADILSLLVFGKTLKEMRQDDGGSGLSARQLLGSILADSVASGVKGATGLDIVEMEFGEGADGGAADDVRVTLGKELSRRITVKYDAEIKKGETIQKVISEYKILEQLVVSAFQDTAGNFGGALTFRMEFR